MRTLALLLLTAAVGGTGCVTLTPVGPMAKTLGAPADGTRVTAEGARVKELTGKASAGPLLRPAPPPTPPAMLVTPAEVTDANPGRAAQRLTEELEADRKAAEGMPRYGELSVVRAR